MVEIILVFCKMFQNHFDNLRVNLVDLPYFSRRYEFISVSFLVHGFKSSPGISWHRTNLVFEMKFAELSSLVLNIDSCRCDVIGSM